MWKPRLDFIALHYVYIISCSLLGFILFVAPGNVPIVDSLFFGASACTESGLNTVDVMDLDVYQQIVIYILAAITNLGFVSIVVVVIRLYWFKKRLSYLGK
jgi:Trk-type K+ transport system membrane component